MRSYTILFTAPGRPIESDPIDMVIKHSDPLIFMLQAHLGDRAAAGDAHQRDAGGGGEIPGRVEVLEATGPVAERGLGHVDGAVDVAGGDARGTQQGDGQAGDVHGVAALTAQGDVGILHGTPAGLPFHVVAYPAVDLHRIVVEQRGLVLDL